MRPEGGIDYYFKVRKGKIIPGGKIISGLTNMFIADVPTPVGIPFAYFPSSQTQESGFIIPSIGESNLRGYYIQNGGYYLALSDYFDFTLIADYYIYHSSVSPARKIPFVYHTCLVMSF